MTRIHRRAVPLLALTSLALGSTLAAISTAGDQPENAKNSVKSGLRETRAAGNTQEDLDVRAAIAAADVAKYLYLKNKDAYDTGKNSIPLVEVKRLESAYQLAVLQVEQAERRANNRDTAGDQTDDDTSKPNAALNESGVASEANEDLDVRIAKAAADVAKYTYLKNKEAYDKVKNSVPLAEVRRLESAYKLALLKAEQAERRAKQLTGEAKAGEVHTTVAGAKPAEGSYAELAESAVAEADARKQPALQEPRFEQRKAELDLREAKVVFDSKKLNLQRLIELQAGKSVSKQEVDQAKLATEVAEIQLERAQLGLERANLKVDQQLPWVYLVTPGNNGPDDRPTFSGGFPLDIFGGELTVKQVLDLGGVTHATQVPPQLGGSEQVQKQKWRVAVVRFKETLRDTLSGADQLKPTDGVLIQDLLDGKAKNEVLHHGDFVIVMRAAAETPTPPAEKPKETAKP